MIIIGEKINGSIPAVAKAIAERDAAFIKARAIAQERTALSKSMHPSIRSVLRIKSLYACRRS